MKKRHQIMQGDHSELRLTLFFFDEKVAIARQAVIYLE